MCPACDGSGELYTAQYSDGEEIHVDSAECEWCTDIAGLMELIPYVGEYQKGWRIEEQWKAIRTLDYLMQLSRNNKENRWTIKM